MRKDHAATTETGAINEYYYNERRHADLFQGVGKRTTGNFQSWLGNDIHGDDDQIVPIGASALLSSKIVKNATLKIYPGAPHGLCSTHKEQVNADLLAFFKA